MVKNEREKEKENCLRNWNRERKRCVNAPVRNIQTPNNALTLSYEHGSHAIDSQMQ